MTVHRWKLNPRKRHGWGKHFEPDYYFWEAFVPRPSRNRDAIILETLAWDDGTELRRCVKNGRGHW